MLKNKPKVSFDFDSTLSRKDVQEYAKELIQRGFEVIITTSRSVSDLSNYTIKGIRSENMNEDLYKVADDVGIPRYNIFFTEMEDKVEHLNENEIIFHLDDDVYEINDLPICGVHLNDDFWKIDCELKIARKLKDRHNLVLTDKISRFEVIDETGRAYTKYKPIEVSIQDESRTLKIFIK